MRRGFCVCALMILAGIWVMGGAPFVLWGADEEPEIQQQDMAVSRIYVEDIQYLTEGLIEVRIGMLIRDVELKPLRRVTVGIGSSRPDKDLFYDMEGNLTQWQQTDYDGRASFLMRTSVEGALRVGAAINEDQIIWPLVNYLYGYGSDPAAANLVAGKVLDLVLNRNDSLKQEGVAPHEEEQTRPFYGAGRVTFYLDSNVMVEDGAIRELDAAPVLRDGVTFLPLRAAVQALGASAQWDVNFKTAILTRGDRVLRVQSQSGEMIRFVPGEPQPMSIPVDPPPYMDESAGRVMIPLRAIADAFDAVIWYDQASRSIHLIQQGLPSL